MIKQKKIPQRRPNRDDPAQSRAFIKKAREIEANEEQSDADALIEHLLKKPPESRKPKHPDK